MWEINSVRRDPLGNRLGNRESYLQQNMKRSNRTILTESISYSISYIVSASVPIDEILEKDSPIWLEGMNRILKVGIADFLSRRFRESKKEWNYKMYPERQCSIRLEGLEEALQTSKRRKPSSLPKKPPRPYILERSDFYCRDDRLHILIRLVEETYQEETKTISIPNICKRILDTIFVLGNPSFRKCLLGHLSCLVLQQKLRMKLMSLEAIAFVADGSILPRKSGASDAPMTSPPAVPFRAPEDSRMAAKISIDIGSLAEHLTLDTGIVERIGTTIVLSGLIVPKGITLICGGGYHGE